MLVQYHLSAPSSLGATVCTHNTHSLKPACLPASTLAGWFTVCDGKGSWSTPMGRCWRAPQFCYEPPATQSGNRTQDWENPNIYDEGAALITYCQDAYTGSFQAVCAGGGWKWLSGGCYSTSTVSTSTLTLTGGTCSGTPGTPPANSDWTWDCTHNTGMIQGDACR